jgi:hypothetical protein
MDFLFHLVGLPFQAVGAVFNFLLGCFSFIFGLGVLVISLPIMLVWGIFKGTFGVLLSVVLFFGSPLGIGAHSKPASSPQLAYQAIQTEASSYSKPVSSPQLAYQATSKPNSTSAISEPVFFPHDPIRHASSGEGCRCPYDFDKKGHQCGGNSAYSRPGGSEPRCYKDD